MRTWKRSGYKVVEQEFDYSLHQFAVIVPGKKDQIITPDSIESMNSIIADLDNGEEVEGWEDGIGNTIYTTMYRGIVKDQMGTFDTKHTKYYETYQEAHDAAEKLCKRTMGDRGTIDVETK